MEDLVPHGLPMRVLEEMTDWEPGRASCRLKVRSFAPFCDKMGIPASFSIEYMGQAVAACLGYEAYQSGNNVRVGMIVGVRKLEMRRPYYPVGAELRVVVQRLRGDEDVSVFSGEVHCDGKLASTALMTLVHPEKPPL